MNSSGKSKTRAVQTNATEIGRYPPPPLTPLPHISANNTNSLFGWYFPTGKCRRIAFFNGSVKNGRRISDHTEILQKSLLTFRETSFALLFCFPLFCWTFTWRQLSKRYRNVRHHRVSDVIASSKGRFPIPFFVHSACCWQDKDELRVPHLHSFHHCIHINNG